MQRASLKRDVDELSGNSLRIEMRFRLFEVFVLEHPQADTLAGGLLLGALERQAMMRALLNAAEMDRGGGLVGDLQADHFGVEVAPPRKVARSQHEMARARDVEWRAEVGGRQAHAAQYFTPRPACASLGDRSRAPAGRKA